MRKLLTITGLAVLLLVPSSQGEASEQLTVLIGQALERNPRVLAAESAWKAAQARITTARAWPDPRLGIRFERNPGAVYSLGEARMRMFSISQTIPFPGKLGLRRKMFTRDADRTAWEYQAIRQEIIAQVKEAYYDLFVLQRSVRLLQEQIDLVRAFERTAQVKYSVGQASQHDVLRAQVELALLAEDLNTLEQEDIITAAARLNTLLDHPPERQIELPEDIDLPVMDVPGERLEAMALKNRPSLGAGEEMVARAEAGHALAKRAYLPDLTVTAMEQRMETAVGEEATRGLRFSLNLPLWFWGKRAEVAEKRALWRGAQLSYRDLKNQVLFEVRQALAEYQAAERRAELFETTIVPLAEQSLKAAGVAYENREIDFLSLISAERNLRQAKLKHYQALGKRGKGLARLEQAVGIAFSNNEEKSSNE
jgi:outer membrane protein TolC